MPSLIHLTLFIACLLIIHLRCIAAEELDPLVKSYLEDLHDDSEINGDDEIESTTTAADLFDVPHCANGAVAQLKCRKGSCEHIGFVCEAIEWKGKKEEYCCHNGVDFDPAEPPEPDLSSELD